MLKAVRQEKILRKLNDEGSVNLTELTSEFGDVSRSTLRRDLIDLASNHPIEITHGGAVLKEGISQEQEDLSLFDCYGKKAVEYIREGDSIFIDAGRTAHSVASCLVHSGLRHLTVATTTPGVLFTLAERKDLDWNIILLGGEYRGMLRSMVGPMSEGAVEKMHADKLFIGCTSLDEKGFYTNYLSEVPLRNLEIEASSEVYLLMSSEKFSRSQGYLVNSLDKITHIITDQVPENKKEMLRRKNVSVILTDREK